MRSLDKSKDNLISCGKKGGCILPLFKNADSKTSYMKDALAILTWNLKFT